MSYMFNKCYNLKQIKGITNFDTTNVTSMNGIFNDCKKLEYFSFSGPISNNTSVNNKELMKELNKQIKKNLNLKDDKNSENEKEYVVFVSEDGKVNCSISYEKYDIFSILENELYLKYPDLKNKNIAFFINGNEINRTSTLEENGIKNDDIIFIKEFN